MAEIKVSDKEKGALIDCPVDLGDLEIVGCARGVGEEGIEIFFTEGLTIRFQPTDQEALEVFARHDRAGFVDYPRLEALLIEGRLGAPEYRSAQLSEHPARISANESATGTVDDKLDQLEVPQTAKTTAPYLDLASLRKSAIAALDGTRIELQTSLDVLEDVELEDLAAKREFCHELTKALRICHCRLVAP